MNRVEYIACMVDTIIGYCPQYIKEDIVEMLGSNDIITKEIYNYGKPTLSHNEILTSCIVGIPETINYLEKWEFLRSYRYSVLAECNNFNLSGLDKLVADGKVYEFSSETVDAVEFTPTIPTLYQDENMILLKLSFLFQGHDSQTSTLRRLKYPVVIAYYKELEIFEIRFDRINTLFKNTDEFYQFYKHKIKFAQTWIKRSLGLEVNILDLESLINEIYNNRPEGVIVSAASLATKGGGKATLDIGTNERDVLPLLGDLEVLIEDNIEVFKRSPEIKELLDNFIKEIKETAELPWASLCWKKKEKKSKKITVKFVHRYAKEPYTLLQHQENLRDMERMNHVARYLIDYRKMSSIQESTEQRENRDTDQVAAALPE